MLTVFVRFCFCFTQSEFGGHLYNENVTAPQMKIQPEKTTYGRLRVLTAPPTSVHEMGAADTASPRDAECSPFSFEAKATSETRGRSAIGAGTGNSAAGTIGGNTTGGQTAAVTGSGSASGGSIATRRSNLRPATGTGSTQRLSGGNRDHSVTQFALIDDDNVSALQQVGISRKFFFEISRFHKKIFKCARRMQNIHEFRNNNKKKNTFSVTGNKGRRRPDVGVPMEESI